MGCVVDTATITSDPTGFTGYGRWNHQTSLAFSRTSLDSLAISIHGSPNTSPKDWQEAKMEANKSSMWEEFPWYERLLFFPVKLIWSKEMQKYPNYSSCHLPSAFQCKHGKTDAALPRHQWHSGQTSTLIGREGETILGISSFMNDCLSSSWMIFFFPLDSRVAEKIVLTDQFVDLGYLKSFLHLSPILCQEQQA